MELECFTNHPPTFASTPSLISAVWCLCHYLTTADLGVECTGTIAMFSSDELFEEVTSDKYEAENVVEDIDELENVEQ